MTNLSKLLRAGVVDASVGKWALLEWLRRGDTKGLCTCLETMLCEDVIAAACPGVSMFVLNLIQSYRETPDGALLEHACQILFELMPKGNIIPTRVTPLDAPPIVYNDARIILHNANTRDDDPRAVHAICAFVQDFDAAHESCIDWALRVTTGEFTPLPKGVCRHLNHTTPDYLLWKVLLKRIYLTRPNVCYQFALRMLELYKRHKKGSIVHAILCSLHWYNARVSKQYKASLEEELFGEDTHGMLWSDLEGLRVRDMDQQLRDHNSSAEPAMPTAVAVVDQAWQTTKSKKRKELWLGNELSDVEEEPPQKKKKWDAYRSVEAQKPPDRIFHSHKRVKTCNLAVLPRQGHAPTWFVRTKRRKLVMRVKTPGAFDAVEIDALKCKLGLVSARSIEWLDSSKQAWIIGKDRGTGNDYATQRMPLDTKRPSPVFDVAIKTGCAPLAIYARSTNGNASRPWRRFSAHTWQEVWQVLLWRHVLGVRTTLDNLLWLRHQHRCFSVGERTPLDDNQTGIERFLANPSVDLENFLTQHWDKTRAKETLARWDAVCKKYTSATATRVRQRIAALRATALFFE